MLNEFESIYYQRLNQETRETLREQRKAFPITIDNLVKELKDHRYFIDLPLGTVVKLLNHTGHVLEVDKIMDALQGVID